MSLLNWILYVKGEMFHVAIDIKKAKRLDVLIDLCVALISQIKGIGIFWASHSVLSCSHQAFHLLLFQLNI